MSDKVPDFKTASRRDVHPWKLLWECYAPQKKLLILTLLIFVVAFTTWPVGHYIFGQAINEVVAGTAVVFFEDGTYSMEPIWFWIIVMYGYWAIRAIADYIAVIMRTVLMSRAINSLRKRIFETIQSFSQDYYRQHGAGELISRSTRDSDKVLEAMYNAIPTMIEVLLMSVGALGLLFIYHPTLSVVPILLFCASAGILFFQAKRLTLLHRETDDAYDSVTQDLTEGVEGVRVIKAFSLEEMRISRFDKHVKTFMDHVRRVVGFVAVRMSLPQALLSLGHAYILVVGVYLLDAGLLEVGDLTAVTMVFVMVIFRMDSIGNSLRILSDARSSLMRIDELLQANAVLPSHGTELMNKAYGLRVEGVTLKSDEGQYVLKDLTFEVPLGQRVALVGATGSGKSALCQFLSRLQDPQEGEIYLTEVGEDKESYCLRDCRLQDVRSLIQIVFQDSFLFSLSVKENLQVARPGATDEEIEQALHIACAEDIIAGLEDGLETKIGERGVTLSGGQKQRLCLARALLARPRILVLDDSTSAVDAQTEQKILQRMEDVFGDMTVLMISNRLVTILRCERVLVIEGGELIADGHHKDLAESNMRYRELLCLDAEDAA